MKKKYLQKVLAVAMTGAMALGVLAGCGSEPASSGNESSAPSSQEESSEEEAPEESSAEESSAEESSEAPAGTAGIDGWEPFAERVTLKIPVYDRGDAGNGCSDVVNNYWTNWVQENFGEKYNIDVEYVAITRTAVMNDYAMLAAGQDLPTICMEYDYDKLATWQAEGYLQPYDVEQFKTMAPTFCQTMADY